MAELTEQEQEMEEKPPFFARVKKLFSKQKEAQPEEAHYKRKFFDGRIERYLDENFNNYIEEFGLVTRVDTLEYEEKYDILVQRITNLKTFINTADADISSLERKLKNVKTAANKK